jgi:hypothetical protein
VAVLDLFALAFFSATSARGQWKSPFPLAVILEPPVKIAFPLAVFLSKPPVEIAFSLAVLLRKPLVEMLFSLAIFLFSHQWKFSRLFLNFCTEIYIYLHTQTYILIKCSIDIKSNMELNSIIHLYTSHIIYIKVFT